MVYGKCSIYVVRLAGMILHLLPERWAFAIACGNNFPKVAKAMLELKFDYCDV